MESATNATFMDQNSQVLDEQPKLSELQVLVLQDPTACSKWEDVVHLADDDDGAYLDELAEKPLEDGKHLLQVFKKWLHDSKSKPHVHGKATWRCLVAALTNLKLHDAVIKVESHLGSLGSSKTETLDQQVCPPIAKIAAHPSDTKASPPLCIPVEEPIFDKTQTSLPEKVVTGNLLHELPEPKPNMAIDYSLKMKDGHKVRNYQHELAKPGIAGENYIIIAPTGSGKTLVAGLVISDHLNKNQNQSYCHVVFIVNTKPLAEQQKKQLGDLIPDARVDIYTGETLDSMACSIDQNYNITVCTAGKLLAEIKKGHVKFDQFSLMVFDECHHTMKGHPYAQVMERYLEHREEGGKLPQVMGMTASPGAGDNSQRDKTKTIAHLLDLAAFMNATSGFWKVSDPENLNELHRCTKSSSTVLIITKTRGVSDDSFIQEVAQEMSRLEELVPALGLKNKREKWSQEYETGVQQLKRELESSLDKKTWDIISILDLLCCYSSALNMYMDLQQKDAIRVMEKYTGLPEDAATRQEQDMKHDMNTLLKKLRKLQPIPNPLLEEVEKNLYDKFEEDPTSRAMIFVRTKMHAYAMRDWITECPRLQNSMITPDVITGHTNKINAGMTQVEQDIIMRRFCEGETNLLIATSVAEEGLDVPECNLVIRFQHVSNEIAKVQTEGRARAEKSVMVTILPSDSRKKNQELKNKDLILLVEEIFENNWFPSGKHLKADLAKIQHDIVNQRKLKALMRKQKRQKNASSEVKLFCKRCKEFACLGSDIYTIGSASFHYIVPDHEFEKKIKTKLHRKPIPLFGNEMSKTHKIHCINCDKDWGVQYTEKNDSRTFPVLKCASFTFEIKGEIKLLRKWADASFEMEQLSLEELFLWATDSSESDTDTDADLSYD